MFDYTCTLWIQHTHVRTYKGSGCNYDHVLLMLHGLFGNGLNFGLVAKNIMARVDMLDIVALDLRNHGSSFHRDRMAFDDMEDDLMNLVFVYNDE